MRLISCLPLVLVACHRPPPPATAKPITPSEIVNAPDRTEADRALDPGRHPEELLAFLALPRGAHIAELGAGGGYTTELLARAVGPQGVVYAENSPIMLQRFAENPWTERMLRPALKNVVRVDRDFDDPLPPEATDLDAVVFAFVYHDTVWLKTDRDRMNRAVFGALKPGGAFYVLDNSARSGSGLADVQTFHRIDQRTLVAEVTKAGFRLAAESGFLRNPQDARDWNDSPREAGPRRGTSDRFALKFIKPAAGSGPQ